MAVMSGQHAIFAAQKTPSETALAFVCTFLFPTSGARRLAPKITIPVMTEKLVQEAFPEGQPFQQLRLEQHE
jgi:hypothetical protein